MDPSVTAEVIVLGGEGNDSISVQGGSSYSLDSTSISRPGSKAVHYSVDGDTIENISLAGTAGHDVLSIQGCSTYTVAADGTIQTGGGPNVALYGMETVHLHGTAGANAFNLLGSMAGVGAFCLYGGDLSDTFTVTAPVSSAVQAYGNAGDDVLSVQPGMTTTVSFNGGAGTDTTQMQGGAGADTFVSAAGVVYRVNDPAVHTGAVEQFSVGGGDGNDTLVAHPGMTATVFFTGGAGHDTVQMEGTRPC